MDKLTSEQRKKNMQAVKSKDSKIEVRLRKILWNKGYRYRKNLNSLPGKPDIVFTKYRVTIFCDSEFWHGYHWANKKKEIKSNKDFWIKKIESNISRDKEVNKILEESGWVVLRFWGQDITKNINDCVKTIEDTITKMP